MKTVIVAILAVMISACSGTREIKISEEELERVCGTFQNNWPEKCDRFKGGAPE